MSNPLARIVRDTMDAKGWSYADVAKACDLPRSTVYAIATKDEQRTTNRPETLEKLAHGLGLPLSDVRNAAAGSAGYAPDEIPTGYTTIEARLVADLVDDLPVAKREQVLYLAQALADEVAAQR